MNEFDLQDYLIDLILNDDSDSANPRHVESFDDRGVLSNNAGIVIRTPGEEFHITIVKAK